MILFKKKKKRMKIKDFKNKRVTIMGLGLHGGGVGVARFFTKIGAKVLVTDLKNKEELRESIEKLKDKPIKYVLGQHRPEDFINTDLIIKNPAVPENSRYLEIAKEHQILIETDMGIFFEICPALIIGVTGTKGKSTVASLIAKFLEKKYSEVILAGNIRASVLEKLFKIKKDNLVVLELSSWQLAGLRPHQRSPHCSVITNIMPDHFNRYKSMTEYIEDKKQIFRWHRSKPRLNINPILAGQDHLILNYDDRIVREFAQKARAKIFYYSQFNGSLLKSENASLAAFVKGDYIYFDQKSEEICSLDDIRLKGEHNISNVLAAVSVAKLFKISNKSIKKVLNEFKGIAGRLELIKIVKGVKYINDTTATTPEACLAALSSFSSNKGIILIAGGADKNLDFNNLAEMIVKKVKAVILLEGTATAKLKKAIEKQAESINKDFEIIGPLNEMNQAVLEAQKIAGEKDIVLLSPACASFGLFKHEFERGEAFNKAVESLK